MSGDRLYPDLFYSHWYRNSVQYFTDRVSVYSIQLHIALYANKLAALVNMNLDIVEKILPYLAYQGVSGTMGS